MTPTPNLFAFVVLLSWPLVALWLYRARPIGPATVWTILGAYLLLPVGTAIKFEMIPVLDKSSIPNLAALIGCIFIAGRRLSFWRGFGLSEILILVLVFSPFISSVLNGDPVSMGEVVLPGVGLYDAGSAIISQFIILLPFFLGRQYFRTLADNAEILRALVIAGVLYSAPILLEVRMSPQLHVWVYGYLSHNFDQQVRDGGYRAMVFMGHGLIVAFFVMTTVVAAAAVWKTRTRVLRLPAAGITAYLSLILILCRSLGTLVYGAVLVPLVRFSKPRLQVRIAMLLAILALAYPILRIADVFPTKSVLEIAHAVSDDRAGSLQFRFENEDRLLERAAERFLFGWGRFGRNRIINEETGQDSVTDGTWIITMGQFGFIGFLAEFGLLALGVFRATSALRFTESPQDGIFLAALALIVAINMIDLLPNSSLRPWTWLLAGALLGRTESLLAGARQPKLRLSPDRTT